MQTIKPAIALALLSILAPLPVFAAPKMCDQPSYWQTTDGRCIDLSSLTTLGALQTGQIRLQQAANPLVVQGLTIDKSTGITYIKGSAYNQSRKSVRGFRLVVNVSKMEDGYKKQLTSESIAVPGTIPPGGYAAIRWMVEEPPLPNDAIIDVQSLNVY